MYQRNALRADAACAIGQQRVMIDERGSVRHFYKQVLRKRKTVRNLRPLGGTLS